LWQFLPVNAINFKPIQAIQAFMMLQTLCLALLCATSVVGGPNAIAKRQSGTSVVNLGNNTGTPQHLASGVLYGIPDKANQIPDHFYTDMGFNYARAGGAQIPAPGRGWIWGLTEYKVRQSLTASTFHCSLANSHVRKNRFASALSNYKTTREYNANFIFLIHDLWGADGTQNSSAPYPGDNGDWSSWDAYLTQWISDMNANGATAGLSVDIWNEPDLTGFWNRPQAQYLQMWGRTWHRLRTEWPSVLLIGPAYAGSPSTSNTCEFQIPEPNSTDFSGWTNFCSFVKSNSSVPDEWVWHMEGGGGDMESSYGELQVLLKNYGLPNNPVNIDEYSTFPEQVPSGSAWWIAQ
jgi:hypothetical protein